MELRTYYVMLTEGRYVRIHSSLQGASRIAVKYFGEHGEIHTPVEFAKNVDFTRLTEVGIDKPKEV